MIPNQSFSLYLFVYFIVTLQTHAHCIKRKNGARVDYSPEHASQLSITDLKVGEASLQSIQSPQKIQTIPVYKHREAIALLQIVTP